jgi:hypothetical protein
MKVCFILGSVGMCGFECTSWYAFLMWIAKGERLIHCGCLKVLLYYKYMGQL